jgi:hypothetical protein
VAWLSGRRRHRLAGALAATVALTCSPAIAGCSDVDSTGTTPASNRELTKGIAAQIDQDPGGFVSRDVIDPLVNAWRVGSRTQFTQVDAGALTRDGSIGALAVFRYDFATAKQDTTLIKVLGAGPVRVERAPMGGEVEDSAQRKGKIEFSGRRGVGGTLDLSDDTVSLRPATGD